MVAEFDSKGFLDRTPVHYVSDQPPEPLLSFPEKAEAGTSGNRLFSEPSGVSIANGKIYIVDTNNHLIRVADMETAEVATLELTGL